VSLSPSVTKTGERDTATSAVGAKGVFVRESTGLVRNVSLIDALSLNMGNMSAGAALATIGFTMTALPSVSGVNLVWGSIIAFLFSVPQMVIYTIMGRRISRTGGDYVWVTRTLGGFLGSSLSFMGYTLETLAYLALIVLSAVFAIGSVGLAMGNLGFLGLALPGYLPGSDTVSQFLLGAGIFALLIAVNIVRPRIGYRIVTTCIALGVAAIVVSIAILLAAGHTGVVNYVNGLNLVDASKNPITYDSLANSYSGPSFDLGATISILPFFAIFVYPWMNAGPAVGSELKGARTQRWNIPIASVIVLVLVTAAFGTMYAVGGLPFTNQALANPVLVFDNSFNFWTLAMGVSGSTTVQAFIGLGWILWNVGILAYGVIVISRYLLAQAFDRFLPSKIAYVSPRFGSPVIAQTLVLVLTVALIGATAFLYGSLQALFAAVIAAMIYFAFVGITAMVHATRHERGGTKTLLMVSGLLTTLVFAYITYQFLSAPTIWGTAASVGGVPGYLVAYGYVAGSFILGAVIYLASKSYHAKKGVDLSLAFKEIPPE
jgi:glutamate:GABA antiporter